MASGISSGLNMVLSRISYLQNNLEALETFQDNISSSDFSDESVSSVQKPDFKTIFEQKKYY